MKQYGTPAIKDNLPDHDSPPANVQAPDADADGVARALGCCRQTVERLARRGDIPHYRIGRLLKFNLRDVLRTLGRPVPSQGRVSLPPGASVGA